MRSDKLRSQGRKFQTGWSHVKLRVQLIAVHSLFLLAAGRCGTPDSSTRSQVGAIQPPQNLVTDAEAPTQAQSSDERLLIFGCIPGQGVHLKWTGAPSGLLETLVGETADVYEITASSVEVHVHRNTSPSVVINSGWIQRSDGTRVYFHSIDLLSSLGASYTTQSRD